MHPITIIGGGLAGLSLAIGLRRLEVPVEVLEAGRYPRHRVCGEFISGLNDATIERLGLATALQDAVSLHHMRWYDRRGLLREDELPEPARGISRWLLDERLVNSLETLGGQLQTETRSPRPDGAAGVVDCAGRLPGKESQWIGLKCHLQGFPLESDLEMHMSARGYVGLSRIEHGRVNVCGLFRNAGLRPAADRPFVEQYIEHCDFAGLLRRFRQANPVEGSACSIAALSYGSVERSAGSMHLGDAQGLIPPFTGNGMTIAFESAALALEPLRAFSAGEQSWSDCSEAFAALAGKRFGRRLKVARTMHRWLVSPTLFPLTAAAAKTPVFPFQSLFRMTRS